MPSIDRSSSLPYYQQVYKRIAEGIENGAFSAGEKLPSIRECARELGVSNTTIELAYRRLVDEGYVEAKRGSGFTIRLLGKPAKMRSEQISEEYSEALQELEAHDSDPSQQPSANYDFAYDAVDASTFPFAIWARKCREVFFDPGAEAACLYNDRQGLQRLRAEIARYLNTEYGIGCIAGQVLIMPTTRDLISEIISLFDSEQTTIAMEEPGYDEVRNRLNTLGFSLRDLHTYSSPEWNAIERMLEGVQLAFFTPACQFPSNRTLPIETRKRIVEWASDTDAYVIDDEYGWEFQSGVARMPSLGALDKNGRVITIGTFSNSFTPAVSLSYAVLPPQLMLKWREKRRDAHPQVPWQTQAAMSIFMHDNHWRSHVRRIRTMAHKKHQQLIESLNEHIGESIEVVEGASSLFVLVKTLDGRSETELIEAAARAGVKVYPTSRYWSGPIHEDWKYVLIGYAGIPLESIDEGIRALAAAWGF